ncbi:alpha-1,2-fucosyltransferase [Hymenobacter sp. HDW8]|uniref:alpha-1,2-fucosyltransferase n=1 Tax=Hymenobacter sp. HDW8 TaxID=2714932 RepID=UPI00140B0BEE|nr:alpha-1,2-fucosyltransferase [Hymenobacter sp. HDW8]QIL77245.1 alpha-1,2-fucosyltransferase [Hymenobacter sp. HDW8]
MIVVKLVGGLGNQMFQYALGRKLALAKQQELRFDFRFLERSLITSTPRALELHVFPAVEPHLIAASASQLRQSDQYLDSTLFKAYNRGRKLMGMTPAFSLTTDYYSLAYKPEFLQTQGELVYVDGLWQSERWFDQIAQSIRNDFVFPSFVSAPAQEIAPRIRTTNSVSLHIRRGDYLTEAEAAKYASVCSLEYYEHAIDEIVAKTGKDITVYVFSDDIAWAEQNLKVPYPCVFVKNAPSSLVMRICT